MVSFRRRYLGAFGHVKANNNITVKKKFTFILRKKHYTFLSLKQTAHNVSAASKVLTNINVCLEESLTYDFTHLV